jgi:hypothetical protein
MLVRSRCRFLRALAASPLVFALVAPALAGTVRERPKELLDALRQRVQGIRGYAVTIHYTKKNSDGLKRNVIRYESWGPSVNIRIRYLEGERAGLEALYTASRNKVEVKLPHVPVTLSLNPDELGGERPIYETDLRTIVGQLQSPGWEVKDLTLDESVGWPLWALTMENPVIGQRVVLRVDQKNWLPRRIELFKSGSSEYEVWKFEDYLVDPPSQDKAPVRLYLSNSG